MSLRSAMLSLSSDQQRDLEEFQARLLKVTSSQSTVVVTACTASPSSQSRVISPSASQNSLHSQSTRRPSNSHSSQAKVISKQSEFRHPASLLYNPRKDSNHAIQAKPFKQSILRLDTSNGGGVSVSAMRNVNLTPTSRPPMSPSFTRPATVMNESQQSIRLNDYSPASRASQPDHRNDISSNDQERGTRTRERIPSQTSCNNVSMSSTKTYQSRLVVKSLKDFETTIQHKATADVTSATSYRRITQARQSIDDTNRLPDPQEPNRSRIDHIQQLNLTSPIERKQVSFQPPASRSAQPNEPITSSYQSIKNVKPEDSRLWRDFGSNSQAQSDRSGRVQAVKTGGATSEFKSGVSAALKSEFRELFLKKHLTEITKNESTTKPSIVIQDKFPVKRLSQQQPQQSILQPSSSTSSLTTIQQLNSSSCSYPTKGQASKILESNLATATNFLNNQQDSSSITSEALRLLGERINPSKHRDGTAYLLSLVYEHVQRCPDYAKFVLEQTKKKL